MTNSEDPTQQGREAAAQALAEIRGCFEAALCEGLQEAVAETTDLRLKDLIERRLMHACNAALTPTPLTPEDHQVLRSAVRDSAEVVAPGRMEEPAHPAWCSCGACNPETAKTNIVETCPGAPTFDGSAAYEAYLDAAEPARTVAAPLDLRRASKWGRVYDKASRLMAVLGRDGEVSTRSDEVSLLMDALCDLDGGEHMPGLMPALSTPPTPEAEPAQQDTSTVPLKFLRGFLTLAHNYSLTAEAPDYYHGVERDAFTSAYARCGQDLARLRAMLDLATPPAEKQAAPTWTPDQVQQVEKEAESMLGKLQASPQAPSGEASHSDMDEARALWEELGCIADDEECLRRFADALARRPSHSDTSEDAMDAARWRMLPAFFEEYQIDALSSSTETSTS